MYLDDYLDKYQDISLIESPFNEIDAMIFASLAYPHYGDFLLINKDNSNSDILNALKYYDDSHLMKRRREYLRILSRVAGSNRFSNMKLINYQRNNNPELEKQFQAVSFAFKDYIVVSFCGTDGTVEGIKEDINMSFLDITPSEIEAIEYLSFIAHKYKKKKIYVVGHSKGGRLAITASKYLTKKDNLMWIYAFDSPNYSKRFYDNEYEKISPIIKFYAPVDSIIGRLITEPVEYHIVNSNNSLIMQHDTFSWLIIDNHFEYVKNFSKRSTRIVNTLNSTVVKYDLATKKEFTATLFNLLERLNFDGLSTKEKNLASLKEALKKLPAEWKNTPKEERKVLKEVLSSMILDYIKDK